MGNCGGKRLSFNLKKKRYISGRDLLHTSEEEKGEERSEEEERRGGGRNKIIIIIINK